MIVTKAVYVHVHVWNRNCTLYCQTIPVLAMCPPYSSRSGLVPLVAYGLHDQYIQVARVAYTCLYQHLIEHCLIHESYMHVHATSFFKGIKGGVCMPSNSSRYGTLIVMYTDIVESNLL